MKNMKIGETKIVIDDNGNEMHCGLIESPFKFKDELIELKTILTSGTQNIKIVESKIRDYCFMNNVEILSLYNIKDGWLMKKLFIHLIGREQEIEVVTNYIKNLVNNN